MSCFQSHQREEFRCSKIGRNPATTPLVQNVFNAFQVVPSRARVLFFQRGGGSMKTPRLRETRQRLFSPRDSHLVPEKFPQNLSLGPVQVTLQVMASQLRTGKKKKKLVFINGKSSGLPFYYIFLNWWFEFIAFYDVLVQGCFYENDKNSIEVIFLYRSSSLKPLKPVMATINIIIKMCLIKKCFIQMNISLCNLSGPVFGSAVAMTTGSVVM